MSYLAFVSITPIGKKESVSEEVAKAFKIIQKSGLEFQLTAMGTIIESENIDQLFQVIKDAISEVEKENNRVSVLLKIDCRKGKSNRIQEKVDSVLKKIQ